jgi:hypothetical protein
MVVVSWGGGKCIVKEVERETVGELVEGDGKGVGKGGRPCWALINVYAETRYGRKSVSSHALTIGNPRSVYRPPT